MRFFFGQFVDIYINKLFVARHFEYFYAKKNNLTGRERSFYDALVANKSAVELMSDDILRVMAMELKAIVEEYATVDWSKKKDTRAKMRMQIKRLLKKYNYPPDYTEEAISRVVDQAEFMMYLNKHKKKQANLKKVCLLF
ncbi:MAG: DUF3387 domain-containing protein [Candidatus Onthomorpha sp.]|nr:DUF3387 domain-containing protein [Candidatus Onthomorpha sp.]